MISKEKFDLKTLELLKSEKFQTIDNNYKNDLIDLLKQIKFNYLNFNKSFLEKCILIENEYIIFCLHSDVHISIEITLYNKGLDLVCANQYILEMSTLTTSNKHFIYQWLSNSIINKVKFSGKNLVYSEFINADNNKEILFKSKSIFNCFYFNNFEERLYKSWI